MARRGYRRLTPEELRAHGYSEGSERYLHESTGETLSRRQYDNRRFVDLGWRSRDDYERRYDEGHSNMGGYRRWRDAAIAKGIPRSVVDDPGSEFNRLFLAARADDFDRGRRRRGPRSPIAKLLVYTGLRSDGATYSVGGSP